MDAVAHLNAQSLAVDAISDPGCQNIPDASTELGIPLPNWIAKDPMRAVLSTNYKLRMGASCSFDVDEIKATFAFDGEVVFGAAVDIVGSKVTPAMTRPTPVCFCCHSEMQPAEGD